MCIKKKVIGRIRGSGSSFPADLPFQTEAELTWSFWMQAILSSCERGWSSSSRRYRCECMLNSFLAPRICTMLKILTKKLRNQSLNEIQPFQLKVRKVSPPTLHPTFFGGEGESSDDLQSSLGTSSLLLACVKSERGSVHNQALLHSFRFYTQLPLSVQKLLLGQPDPLYAPCMQGLLKCML